MDSPLTDPHRLRALESAALLDTPAEMVFDRLTNLASRILGVPVALVSLVTPDRQFFKSQCGLPSPFAESRETPLSHSFCQYDVEDGAALVVEDARLDERLADNRAIPDLGVTSETRATGTPRIRDARFVSRSKTISAGVSSSAADSSARRRCGSVRAGDIEGRRRA